MFHKMPFVLVALIIMVSLFHPWLPISLQSVLYAVSLSLKSIIVFALPFLIFGLLFKTAVQLSKKASKIVGILLAAVCISNFISTMLSYQVGTLAYHLDLSMAFPEEQLSLLPAWQFSLPKLIGNDTAMFSALILGIFLSKWRPQLSEYLSVKVEQAIKVFLKFFLLIIPFFILGFVVKMNHDQVMTHILSNYALVFSLVAAAVFSYVILLYFIANRFQGKASLSSLKNMCAAAVAGFGTMSSAAAMPLTILGAEKNSRSPDLARAIIPATVNIHLIGDCFAIPIFAFAVLKNFGMAEPAMLSYLTFALYFILAKFSVAAVPGGGILVMLPILESTLGFNAEMLSLITALYILFDPIITSANILGNGGFALLLDRMLTKKKTTQLAASCTLEESAGT